MYVGLAKTVMYIYGVNKVFLTGKSPNIRSYTVHIYGVNTVFLTGKSPNHGIYGVYIHGYGQPYMYMWVWLKHG